MSVSINKARVVDLANQASDAFVQGKTGSLNDAISDVVGATPYSTKQLDRIAQATNQATWAKLSSVRAPSSIRFEPANGEEVFRSVQKEAKRKDDDPAAMPPIGLKPPADHFMQMVEKQAGANDWTRVPDAGLLGDEDLEEDVVMPNSPVQKAADASRAIMSVEQRRRLEEAEQNQRGAAREAATSGAAGAVGPAAVKTPGPRFGAVIKATGMGGLRRIPQPKEASVFQKQSSVPTVPTEHSTWARVYGRMKIAEEELVDANNYFSNQFRLGLSSFDKAVSQLQMDGISSGTIKEAVVSYFKNHEEEDLGLVLAHRVPEDSDGGFAEVFSKAAAAGPITPRLSREKVAEPGAVVPMPESGDENHTRFYLVMAGLRQAKTASEVLDESLTQTREEMEAVYSRSLREPHGSPR